MSVLQQAIHVVMEVNNLQKNLSFVAFLQKFSNQSIIKFNLDVEFLEFQAWKNQIFAVVVTIYLIFLLK